MYETIGELIPLAAGIALSPIPIIAATLVLLTPRHVATSLGFLAGWLIGIALVGGLFVLIAEALPQSDPEEPRPIAGVIKIILGVGLLILAARKWRSRPQEGDQPESPAWMAQINEMSGLKATRFGLMLAALNPKNLLLAAAAGLSIAESEASDPLLLTIFVVLASLTVLIPITATLIAPRAMKVPLVGLRSWLLANNSTIMTVLLLVIGLVVMSGGIGSF